MSAAPNALAASASSYLRSAAHQPVQWLPWGDEAFARANAENKPILLDVGAVWCHWCHVMDGESYENPDTAALINQHFIAIKVDRDERPDIDTRYQAAVSAISGQGGWPLTVFLTPDGQPYFGGTYFPPEERYGRPSFQRVLLTMASSFHNSPEDVAETAASVMDAIAQSETFTADPTDLENPGNALAITNTLIAATLEQFDPIHGGFGSQPKFLHPAALTLLADAAQHNQAAAEATVTTLKKMARGGIFDQLAGGFHRYSTDERWIVPHFEKMAYDNATLLSAYAQAFSTFPDPELGDTARATLRWMSETLADRTNGGFYASQDADLNIGDDGNYFTWTRGEAAAVLDPGELKLAEAWFDIGPIGDMHHDPARNVLHRPLTLDQAAQQAGIPAQFAANILELATRKLKQARAARPAPFVDKTLYTGANGLCISAFIHAGRIFGQPGAVAFAAKSLDRALTALQGDHLNHVIAYPTVSEQNKPIPATLEDHTYLAHAALDTWEATGEPRYYAAAEQLATILQTRFYDGRNAGFFDTDTQGHGALAIRRKPIQDAPTPAGNPSAAALLLRLHALNNNAPMRDNAQETLEAFASVVSHLGLYGPTFGLALLRLARPATQVVILGEGPSAAQLELVALTSYSAIKSVLRLRHEQLKDLPPALAQTLPNLPQTGEPIALVCTNQTCHPPVTTAEALIALLQPGRL